MISLPLKRGLLYFIFTEIQISQKEEMDLLLIIKVKLTAWKLQEREKKWNIKFVMHRVKIYLMVQNYFTFTKE